jgi:hypothetical protein
MNMFNTLPLILTLTSLASIATASAAEYPWLDHKPARTIQEAIPAPPGYHRVKIDAFGTWLRGLPLLPAGSPVLLWNGKPKEDQTLHEAVVDLDVGARDLQQCSDSIIRLRSEWLWASERQRDIGFHFANGTFRQWAGGTRAAFARYLDNVFMYANTASMAREMANSDSLTAGDVLVQTGKPGHAILVLDVAENAKGERVVLLGHGMIPAQQFHVANNPRGNQALAPWYQVALLETTGIVSPGGRVYMAEDVRAFPR